MEIGFHLAFPRQNLLLVPLGTLQEVELKYSIKNKKR